MTVVLDPLSEPAQRAAPILIAIRDELKLPLHVILAPRTQIDGNEGLPLTSYYRFYANIESSESTHKEPSFQNLPSNHVLTLRTDVPEPWNIQQVYAVQDTDNLRCDREFACGDSGFLQQDNDFSVTLNNKDITNVEFGLSSLMFFGQCFDAETGDHPNGLQLTLSKEIENSSKRYIHKQNHDRSGQAEISTDGSISFLSESSDDRDGSEPAHYSDTLVMKNLGYWQLRANPGIWSLSIAKNTVGSKVFDIVEGKTGFGKYFSINKHGQKNFSAKSKTIVMRDFVNRGETLFVKRGKDYEKTDKSLGESLVAPSKAEDEDIIHVFSLATGHLYERLLKIMMLSVTKRASTHVKFWLFENFLSPGFKASAIAMAEEVGCDVQFVTYKWPEWLRGQSEKQRIIWGYKILFLDVLFPLDVKKIIYGKYFSWKKINFVFNI